VFFIPIISISINENLREFINKLVSKNHYENKSKLIRDALLRLMSTMDISNIESLNISSTIKKQIIGNMIENEHKDQIVSKYQHFQGENVILFLLFEGDVQDFQNFVVEVNGIKEIKNFRYLIVN